MIPTTGLLGSVAVDEAHSVPPVHLRNPPENAPPEIDRREQLRVAQHHFRPAEDQDALVGEREVKTRQNPALRLRIEVHQRIAAHQDAHARDRRILNQIVTAEDDRSPQIAVEDESIALAKEIAVEQCCRYHLHLLL